MYIRTKKLICWQINYMIPIAFFKTRTRKMQKIFKRESQKRVVEKLRFIGMWQYMRNINQAPQFSKIVQKSIGETTCVKITDSEGNIQLACYAGFLSPWLLPLTWLILRSKFLVKRTNNLQLPDETKMTIYVCKLQFFW